MAGNPNDVQLNINLMPQVAAIAEPGDTIMIGFDRSLTDDELNELRNDFQGFTEATGVHIGFVEHVSSMVVTKGEVRRGEGA